MHDPSALDDLLMAALELPAPERPGFVESACAGDDGLRASLERVLQELDDDDPYLQPGGAFAGAFGEDLADALARDEGLAPGDRAGPYRIVSELGRGGMAVVYRAERVDGSFTQQVALKIVKRGIDTDEMLTRFRQERQILASLTFPGIARLLDGGETPDGRPYLVMELVQGEPIDQYCNRLALGVDARVDLCLEVARAVQQAHRRLVVHRDLKPSNILVTGDGEVRLLDFGIAKLLDGGSSAAAPPPTRTALRVMTPDYASPEQVRGEPMTTASDVYQIGLVLFELLTGQRAQVVAGLGVAEAERVICQHEMQRPSEAVGGHVPDARRRRRQLHGDLDNIVLTALQKDPERRYSSVDQLVTDLVRHRSGLPVSARADSLAYRFGKFARRHRGAVAGAAVIVMLLSAIVAFYSVRLASERDRARREAATATQVSEFLAGLFRAADPIQSAGAEVTARQLLQRGAERVETELADAPEVQARMMSIIAGIYRSIGLLPESISFYERALDNQRVRLGARHPEVAQTLASFGSTLYFAGQYDASRARYEEALRIQEAVLDPMHADLAGTLGGIGLLERRAGRHDAARQALERALTVRERALGPEHHSVAVLANNLGLVYMTLGNYPRAQQLFERAMALHERRYGFDSPVVGGTLSNLADAFRRAGDLEAARPRLERALAIVTKARGADHRETAASLNVLGQLFTDMKRYAEAIPMFLQAQGSYERSLGPAHPYVAYPVENLGHVYRATRDYARALAQYERALEIRVAAFGESHRDVAQTLDSLGALLLDMDDCARAAPVFRRAIDVTRKTMVPDHTWIGTASLGLGSCEAAAGRHAEAEPLLLDAHRILASRRGADHRDTAEAADRLAAVYEAMGRPEQAASYRVAAP